MKEKSNMRKNFLWNIIGSTLCAFNSLFFMITVTRINGEDVAGLFTFAFSTACLFYIIGIYSGRTYQVTDNGKLVSDSDYIYSKLITCFLMLLASLVFCIIKNYDISKSIIIFSLTIFKVLEAFSEGVYAIIQKNDQLYKVGKSLFVKAVIGLITFIIIDLLTKNIFLSVLGVIIINLLVIIFYDFKNLRLIDFKMKKIDKLAIKTILVGGFYTFAFTILTQYVINAPRYSIDNFLADKDQTIFGIIIMPSTLIALLAQFVIQPYLTKLKDSLKISKKEFNKVTIKLSLALFIMGIICIVVSYFLGIPVLEFVYNIKLNAYLLELLMIIFGATLYGITVILSSSLIIIRNTLSQLIIFLIATIFDLVISNILVKKYLILGASSTYLLTMLLLLVLYITIYIVGLKKYRRD